MKESQRRKKDRTGGKKDRKTIENKKVKERREKEKEKEKEKSKKRGKERFILENEIINDSLIHAIKTPSG